MRGRRPGRLRLPSLLRACGNRGDVRTGESLHAVAVVSSLDDDVFVISSLIDMYSRCGLGRGARKAFGEARERDTVVWNSMIAGYSRLGLPFDATRVFVAMAVAGPQPDLTSWNSLIAAFSSRGLLRNAAYFFNSMELYGLKPDVFSWTSLIAGLVRDFRVEQAMETFRRMVVVDGTRPRSATISALLPACSLLADLRRGTALHALSVVVGVEEDVHVGSALLDMYSKCGSLEEAVKVFEKMPERSTISWNSMIFCYANNGTPSEALALYGEMKKAGAEPDHLTFMALLTACSHGGLVELGLAFFRAIQRERKITPRVEHYACLVDLLGRAGQVCRAKEVVKEMPLAPDRFVWGALLGACRMHGEVETAAMAAAQLARLSSERRGSCLLMSDIFVGFGRWEDAGRMKMLSKGRGLRGLPGCSWVTTS
ncbi:tetratricopeptide repeat (TPR)-like superfamily protein [Wolffia australiana]